MMGCFLFLVALLFFAAGHWLIALALLVVGAYFMEQE